MHEGFTDVLYDLSGGKGITPDVWPSPIPDIACGYAGGLGPENIKEHLPQIAKAAHGHSVWIDAESKLRSDDDKRFDLDKVKAFLEAAKPFICKQPMRIAWLDRPFYYCPGDDIHGR